MYFGIVTLWRIQNCQSSNSLPNQQVLQNHCNLSGSWRWKPDKPTVSLDIVKKPAYSSFRWHSKISCYLQSHKYDVIKTKQWYNLNSSGSHATLEAYCDIEVTGTVVDASPGGELPEGHRKDSTGSYIGNSVLSSASHWADCASTWDEADSVHVQRCGLLRSQSRSGKDEFSVSVLCLITAAAATTTTKISIKNKNKL